MKVMELKCPIKFINPCNNTTKFCDPDCAWRLTLETSGEPRPACAIAVISVGAIFEKNIEFTDLYKESE